MVNKHWKKAVRFCSVHAQLCVLCVRVLAAEDEFRGSVPVVVMFKERNVGTVNVDLTGNDGMTIDRLRAVSRSATGSRCWWDFGEEVVGQRATEEWERERERVREGEK